MCKRVRVYSYQGPLWLKPWSRRYKTARLQPFHVHGSTHFLFTIQALPLYSFQHKTHSGGLYVPFSCSDSFLLGLQQPPTTSEHPMCTHEVPTTLRGMCVTSFNLKTVDTQGAGVPSPSLPPKCLFTTVQKCCLLLLAPPSTC